MAIDKIASVFEVPQEVAEKAAAVDLSKLPNSFFADDINRRYPVFSKEAALASLAEYDMDKDSLPEYLKEIVSGRLLKAIDTYGITRFLNKKASTDFTVTVATEDGNMSLNSTDSAEGLSKLATELLFEVRPKASYGICKQAALQIIKHCDDCGYDLPEDTETRLHKLAGLALGSKEIACEELLKRAYGFGSLAEDKELLKTAHKQLEGIDRAAAESAVVCDNVISMLDAYDEKTGRRSKYASVGTPEDIIYTETLSSLSKIASDVLTIPSIDAMVSKESLIKHAADIQQFLSSIGVPCEGLEDPEKLFTKVASLPEHTASQLLQELS